MKNGLMGTIRQGSLRKFSRLAAGVLIGGVIVACAARVTGAAVPPAIEVRLKKGESLQIKTPHLSMEFLFKSGECGWGWDKGLPAIRGTFCMARLADGRELKSMDYPTHEMTDQDLAPLADEFGKGVEITLHHRAPGKPELRQHIKFYEAQPFFFVSLEVIDTQTIASNYLVPLLATEAGDTLQSGMRLGAGKPLVLGVPFDNDKWVRYNGDHDPAKAPESFEVTAIYDNASRHGFVIGSVSHDLWKTGIEAREIKDNGSVGRLCVYAGAACPGTRDSQPHGMVSGKTISSPRIFVGYYNDWRDGMEAFGQANAKLRPPLPWTGGVPFGWNSWAAYGSKIDFQHYLAVSDFMSKQLQPAGFSNNGAVTLNWDSFWDKMSEAQLVEGVRHLHANGQKAGIYLAPFGVWGNNLNRPVEGTNGKYFYRDIVLKGADGQPVPKLDGGWLLDPTHPGTLARLDWQLGRFVKWGFEFVKFDFLNFASTEGVHYDKSITTGIAAYNFAMKRIVDGLDPEKAGHPIYISLSIAPTFPGGVGHGRRISCDVLGGIKNTEYLLNSVSYGWWMNGTLLPFNDPDHIVLYKAGKNWTDLEVRSQVNAAAIAGTQMIDSDDLTDPAAQARAKALLTNRELNAMAAAGRAFRPVEGDSGQNAADIFVRREPDGRFYLAVFNFSPDQKAAKRVDLERAGLGGGAYRVHDLWTRRDTRAQGAMTVALEPMASTVLLLVKD